MFFTFPLSFTLCKIIIPSLPHISLLFTLGSPHAEQLGGVYGGVTIWQPHHKMWYVSYFPFQGTIQLRLYEASGPHMQIQQTHIPRKLFLTKRQREMSLQQCFQRGKHSIFWKFVREINSYSHAVRGDIFTGPE